MSRTAYFWEPTSMEHDTGPGHVERIARAERLSPEVMRRHIPDLKHLPTDDHNPIRWIEEVHTAAYHAAVRDACASTEGGYSLLDAGDTVVCAKSYAAACTAVNTVLTAADEVISGCFDNAFCVVRPPGHHAYPDRAMGFCLFANVAILARYLQRHHGIKKIAILDWDVHHGNGTQHIFYNDPSVYFVSIHQHPLWPGSGMAWEDGEGTGKGRMLNLPLPPGTTEAAYLDRVRTDVLPELTAFAPEFVLISAGFDSHKDDPLGGLRLTEEGFATLTRWMKTLANDHGSGRLISCLEGGYNLDALENSVAAHVQALMK